MTRRHPRHPLLAAWLLGLALLPLGPWTSAQAQGQPGRPSGPPIAVQGELDVIIEEDFAGQRFTQIYYLRAPGRVWRLEFEREPPGRLVSGARVTVRGRPQNDTLAVEAFDEDVSSAPSDLQMPALAVEERRAVVLMVDLQDKKASSRYTLDQIAGHMWTGARSVAGMYAEASRGQLHWPTDVTGNGRPEAYGPFTVPHSSTSCDYYAWAQSAESQAQAAGIDLSLYRHRVFVLPRHSELACSWAGIANVGCGTFCRAWIAQAESPVVYAHELGHNLGMRHAGTDPENDGVVNSEYGDASDIMGNNLSWKVFNAAHVDQMGWYQAFAGSVATVVASGTYEVAAIGVDPATAGVPLALRIQKSDSNDFYYLSYRQRLGYDDSLGTTYTRGLNIHRYRGSGANRTTFIGSLTDGGRFADAANGITVTQLGRSGDRVSFQVDFGCATAVPQVAFQPDNLALLPGDGASFRLGVSNRDGTGCPTTAFDLVAEGPAATSVLPVRLTLAPGALGTADVALGTLGLADGAYTVRVEARAAGRATGVGTAALVVDGTPPSVPTGLGASVDKQNRVALGWQAASDSGSGIARYTVLRDGEPIGSSTTTSYTDTTGTSGATYAYQVVARDAAGNESAPSAALEVTVGTTKGGGGGGKRKGPNA